MSNYKELVSKVLLRLENPVDGRTHLAVKEAINDAMKHLARAKDWDELMILDTTNAETAASTKFYHLVDDWSLTRPKDIYTLRYMDENSSRKLIYVPARRLDEVIPYTESLGTGKPNWYTRRGDEIELIRVPDADKSVYVFYSQWPEVLSDDTDEPVYSDLDDVIVALATDITGGILENAISDWTAKARELLGISIREDLTRPDRTLIARPFRPQQPVLGEYWKNPFVMKDP